MPASRAAIRVSSTSGLPGVRLISTSILFGVDEFLGSMYLFTFDSDAVQAAHCLCFEAAPHARIRGRAAV
jgi:hypothetical protein